MCKYCDPEKSEVFDIAEENAPWTSLELRNDGGYIVITARGDSEARYHPKFCPECGRPLNQEADLPKCVCGCTPKVADFGDDFWVYCPNCNRSTYHFEYKGEAFEAWERMNKEEK